MNQLLWTYIGNENINKLSFNTKDFLEKYIDDESLNDFTIAMEIHLAEMLIPSFGTTLEYELANRLESFIKSIMDKAIFETKLDPLYFFENLKTLEQKFKYYDVEPKRALMKGLAKYVLENRFNKGQLKSTVAKSLFLQYLKISKDSEFKKLVMLDGISTYQITEEKEKESMYNKMLNIMAAQHKELYYLEANRVGNDFEYNIRDGFSLVLDKNTAQFLGWKEDIFNGI